MSKRPWSHLWPNDWGNDLRLLSCSASARGVFWGIYMLAHQGEGHLSANGQPVLLKDIAAALRLSESETERGIEELTRGGLLTRSPDGTLTQPELQAERDKTRAKVEAALKGQSKRSALLASSGPDLVHQNGRAKRGSGSGSARASKNTPGREEVLQRFTERYLETYQEPYALQGAKDNVALKAMLGKADGSLKVVFEKIDRAFEDAWLCEHGVTLTVLNQNWSRLIDREHINGHPPAQVNGGKLAARIAGILQQGKDLAAKRIEAERKAVQG